MHLPDGWLDRVMLPSPCPVSWTALRGNERVRFCPHCSKHVHNLSGLTRAQAEALVIEKRGQLCVSFYSRADGTVLTRECLQAGLRRRARRGWALFVVLCVAVCSVLAGCEQEQAVRAPRPALDSSGMPVKRVPERTGGVLPPPPGF